jgi:multidrug efflux pump subunit AcrA (membrane-fusion protein)
LKFVAEIGHFIKDKNDKGIVDEVEVANNDLSLQDKARRLLIIFFVMMFALTVLSRVADSITIAKVSTQSPKSSTLTFNIEGSGTITADAKKYVKVQEGIGIERINVETGREVKKGDVLFTLDQSDVNEALMTAKREAEKLENQMEQENLSVTDSNLSTREKAELLYHNAKLDLDSAKEDYIDAKDSYKESEDKLKQAENTYQKALVTNVKQVYSDKTREYNSEEKNYQNIQLSNEESLQNAFEALDSAKKTLSNLQAIDTNIIEYLDDYVFYYGKDLKQSNEALENLFTIAYGDEEAYEKYKDERASLEKKLSRAKEDLFNAQTDLFNSQSADNVTAYQNAVTTAKRAVSDAEEDLYKAMKKEISIRNVLNNYITAKASNNEVKIINELENVKKSIYGTNGYKKHEKELQEANSKIIKAEENYKSVQKKNDLALSIEQDKLDQLQEVIDSIDNGTYDKEEAAQSQKQAVDTAKVELETKKENIKTTKKAVDSAKRALEAAQLDQKQSKEQDGLNETTFQKQVEAASLRASAIQIDLEAKMELVSELQDIQKNHGKIKSPVSGTVEQISYEEGKKSEADNSIVIITGGYGIQIMVPKEQGEYVSIGDEIELTAKGKKDKITVQVDDISFTTGSQNTTTNSSANSSENGYDSSEELTKIIALMPEGEYIPGATLDAYITKNSDLYDICVPLTAIRSEGNETYCLITQPKKTVLGEELLAVKVPVNVVEKDDTMAAVEGALSVDDNVIISSNKNINEGDRVRLEQ